MATAGSGENVLEGFVHVMTEESFRDVLTELDTITDLTEYLAAKESFAHGGTVIVCEGTESNLLGWYLAKNRMLPSGQGYKTTRRSNAGRKQIKWVMHGIDLSMLCPILI